MRLALLTLVFLCLPVALGCGGTPPTDGEQMELEEPPDDGVEDDNGSGEFFSAQLSGSETVPDPVDTNASGVADFELSPNGTRLTFTLSVSAVQDVFAAHIHLGGRGVTGEIAVFLFDDDPVSLTGVLSEGTIRDADVVSSAVTDLAGLVPLMRSGETYVNVHTVAYPAGEIRGQIMPVR